jgi:predicted unusual protein kinase regulating ubiquinone biosynthesis (AarF/ABC1/UbiB family)
MPWATVRQVLTQELGRPPEEAFAEVSEAPLASASLGQVHRAVAKDGTPLAVKVQYPGIAQALLADLENLGAMVSVVAASTRMLHGKAYFAEVREGMLDELDYREEAKRLTQFARAAAPLADLKVPRVYDALTSARVLTLELLHGQTLKDFMQGLPGHPTEERFRAARLLTRAIWGPFLLTGLIHADPHPGNFMLLDDGRLGVLDFGAIKQLSEPWRRVNTTLFEAAVKDLPYDAVALSLESGFTFDRPEEVRDFIEQVVQIAIRAARSPHFDYAQAGTNRLLRNHFLQHPTKVAAIRPPREAVQFFRAIGGLGQNLENLGAAGDFRAVHEELLALLPKR